MELNITWRRVSRIAGAYVWRYLIALIVCTLISAILGGIVGALLIKAGATLTTVTAVNMPLGLILGLIAAVLPLKFIIGKRYGDFRLVLVPNTPDAPAESAHD